MKTLLPTLLLTALLAPGCAVFQEKQEPLYKDVPTASTPDVPASALANAEPAPAPTPAKPVAVESPAPVKPPEPVVPAKPAPAKPVAVAEPAAPVVAEPVRETAPSRPTVTPDLSLRGKVAAYNAVGRFVVLSFHADRMPAIGQEFDVYRGDLKVGEVRITGPQREENTVGDLVGGDASAGDEVRAK